MKNARPHNEAESSALDSVNSKPIPKLTPRQTRAINALRSGPVMREGLDRAAGCSNAPQLVRDLIDKGLDIICTLIDSLDRDGRPCKPGRYELTNKGRETLQQWGWQ